MDTIIMKRNKNMQQKSYLLNLRQEFSKILLDVDVYYYIFYFLKFLYFFLN